MAYISKGYNPKPRKFWTKGDYKRRLSDVEKMLDMDTFSKCSHCKETDKENDDRKIIMEELEVTMKFVKDYMGNCTLKCGDNDSIQTVNQALDTLSDQFAERVEKRGLML